MSEIKFEYVSRMPPHSMEAEESVLSNIFQEESQAKAAKEIVAPEDFFNEGNGKIFAAMISLSDDGDPIDVVTVAQRLKNAGDYKGSASLEKIAALAAVIPLFAEVGPYARAIKQLALRRKVINESMQIIDEAFNAEIVFK